MRKNLTGRPIIMISLDAISDTDVNYLLTLPNFRKLASYGLLHRGRVSIYLEYISGTYQYLDGCSPVGARAVR